MAKLTPQEFQEKHLRRTTAALDDVRKGIERVSVAPTQQAAAKQDKMLANLTASIQSGKWKRGLERVSLEQWKSKTLNKGVNRISTGLQESAQKVVDFASELLPFQDSLSTTVSKMPDVSFEDSINRMVAWSRGMKNFKRTK